MADEKIEEEFTITEFPHLGNCGELWLKMNIDEFYQQIQAQRSHFAAIQKQAGSDAAQPSNLLIEAFEQINKALEALKVTEEELRQQNEELAITRLEVEAQRQRYQDLFEFAPEGYLITDKKGLIQEANRAAAKLLNISQRYIVGKPLAIFVTQPNHFYAKLTQLEEVDLIEEWELGLQPRKQKPIDVAIKISTVRDPNGKLVGLRWLIRDISERKRAEAERNELLVREQVARKKAVKEAIRSVAAQTKITKILESISDAFISLDTEWRYTYVNSQAEKFLGKNATDLIGFSIWEVFPETVNSQTYQQAHRAIIERITIEYEEFFPAFNKWLAFRLYPCVEGLSVYFVDITERKQTEEALRQSEARFRRLVESNIIGSTVKDFNGNIIDANDAFLEIVGYTRQDLLAGKLRWIDMTPEVYSELDRQAIAQVKKVGSCTPYEKEFIHADGTLVPILTGLALLERSEDTCICFVLDLTQTKQLEKQLQQKAKELSQANCLKDEFLAIVSHELRSPLSVILGWAQMLQRTSTDATTTAHAIEVIERSARLQKQLIEDILDVSRITTGKLRLNITPVQLAPLIEATINTVRPAADAKQITINCLLSEPVGSVLGDRDRLQQIIWNLLSNAIKFTPKGGSIEVRLQSIDNNYIEIIVSDTGIGINPEVLPLIFEPFRQADSTITRAYGGMGLGLALVRYLLEMHGGVIDVSSTGEGLGTTFTVKLPVQKI